MSLAEELAEFDKRVKKPLPPAIAKWRKRWGEAVAKEQWVVIDAYKVKMDKRVDVMEKHF